MELRPAARAEASTLTDLALRSKQHWGYDDAFIDACRDELTVTAATVERCSITVADDGRRIAGFSVLSVEPPGAELEWLFVEPGDIRRGVGRALWTHAVSVAARMGVESIRVESDPHAEGFYRRMGAVRAGSVPSQSVAGRWNPLMRFEIAAHRRGAGR